MISVEEAHRQVAAATRIVTTEPVRCRDAAGRVLREPAVATLDQPPFAASAMDGYAIRADDRVPGRRLQVMGEVAAGQTPDLSVSPGLAMRIFTGAPLPGGADVVLIQEDAEREGDWITVRAGHDTAGHVRPRGGDFVQGTKISPPRRLSPADLMLLAAMNVATVSVSRRPVVAIMPTGDELVGLGEVPAPGQIVASSLYGVGALLADAGADVRLLPIARDDPAMLGAILERAAQADMVVTLGGASVGDHDLVRQAAAGQGLDLSFHKIAMRPGKPLICGRLGRAMFLGLPGNPVSSFVCARLFAHPATLALQGLPYQAPPTLTARLAAEVPANGPREHYMRARAVLTEGEWVVTAFDRQDSSLTSVLADADALVVRPPRDPARPAGASVRFLPLLPG